MNDNRDEQQVVKPASFTPPPEQSPTEKRPIKPLVLLLLAALALLVYGLWYVMTATAVKLEVTPPPDELRIEGGPSLEIGGNHLLRPGEYTVVANKTGYHPLSEPITAARDTTNQFRFELRKLAGRLAFDTEPERVRIHLDGEDQGFTPMEPLTLEPGEYSLLASAPRYQPVEASVAIEGLDQLQTEEIRLVPAWADITLHSEPPGATVLVDGEERGETGPEGFVAEVMPGKHTLSLELAGYRPWEYSLVVTSNEPQTLPKAVLEKSLGQLSVQSRPRQARVLVDGEYQGTTPLTLELRPGPAREITVTKAGYRAAKRSVQLASGEEQSLELKLEPIVGKIAVRAQPADALLYIDGVLRGRANQTVELTATEHKLEIKKDGYATFRDTVMPRSGYTQTVEPRLLTEREAYLAQFPKVIETSTGGRLRRIEPDGGVFTMGSPRREQGRQSNEIQRDVRLTKLFYLGTHEVTNEAFRQFRASHSSGIVQRTTLDNDNYPVARVSWADAVAFCNWLSKRDGLPVAYRNGKLIEPVTTGYRLPTEAEWAYAARFAGGSERKYPWGNAMPPAGAAGNYADVSAQGVVSKTLSSYNDGYIAAAPVGSFDPGPLGLYDLGGNVSEWVNDHFSIDVNTTSTETDPLGTGEGEIHVIRGSSWRHGRITELRLVYRDSGGDARDDIGFRLARYAE